MLQNHVLSKWALINLISSEQNQEKKKGTKDYKISYLNMGFSNGGYNSFSQGLRIVDWKIVCWLLISITFALQNEFWS